MSEPLSDERLAEIEARLVDATADRCECGHGPEGHGPGGCLLIPREFGGGSCPCTAYRPAPSPQPAVIDAAHVARQREWSTTTFGPGPRTKGLIDHIGKEIKEIETDPTDLSEWVDVLILALDGAWRAGHEPQDIIDAIKAKQTKNEARTWPDWRLYGDDVAIEHVRSDDTLCTVCGRDDRNGTHTHATAIRCEVGESNG